ncbi:hypothetical protein [Alicyclobacillus mengziensis]|uniref:Uncharacterized protein n=1 Tax=Alicyclobacillus mengziensis TaxID=2931921 RepID=A0A9X7W311_9BACL|nr:hypothetical protein [Alicyclobacillus mengziensis]QSO49395.1 hypothetical protein JZ786_10995 [Alicyclobacillus mengziensis]
MTPFRAGQKVKIRPDADNEFAGCIGVALFVLDSVCDVKITYRPPSSDLPETLIQMFKVSDLESVK